MTIPLLDAIEDAIEDAACNALTAAMWDESRLQAVVRVSHELFALLPACISHVINPHCDSRFTAPISVCAVDHIAGTYADVVVVSESHDNRRGFVLSPRAQHDQAASNAYYALLGDGVDAVRAWVLASDPVLRVLAHGATCACCDSTGAGTYDLCAECTDWVVSNL